MPHEGVMNYLKSQVEISAGRTGRHWCTLQLEQMLMLHNLHLHYHFTCIFVVYSSVLLAYFYCMKYTSGYLLSFIEITLDLC